VEDLKKLQPKEVWKHFFALSSIPRCSGREEAARRYVENLAKKNNLEYRIDTAGNIAVFKPAYSGLEERPGIILQGHLDMVCEKNEGTVHDFETDSLKLKVSGDWLSADGTTLGADNGIAVALGLAVLENPSLKHGPVQVLFTVQEETGLIGAMQIEASLMQGRYLINLDSEEEGVFYIGCAGAILTEGRIPVSWGKRESGMKAFRLAVSGLKGGHSGADIDKGLGNALRITGRLLWNLYNSFDIRINSIKGGGKHNAIPRECFVSFVLPSEAAGRLDSFVSHWREVISLELENREPGFRLRISEEEELPERTFTAAFTREISRLMYTLPHGVEAMSISMPGLVETSTNFAALSLEDTGEIRILTSQRSNRLSSRDDLAERIKIQINSLGGTVIHTNSYPAWTPEPENPFLKKCTALYREVTGREGIVKAIHAGLECGVLGDKRKGLQMISFGPDLAGVHTPQERISVSSVERLWNYLVKLLSGLTE